MSKYKIIKEDYFGFQNTLKDFDNKDDAITYFKDKKFLHIDTFIANDETFKEIKDNYYD